MSAINSNQSRISYIQTASPQIYDNLDTFSSYANLPSSNDASIDRLYYVSDTQTYYKWNGSVYSVAINPASGTVLGVSSGNQINITGTSQNPIINVNTNPTFTTINVTDKTTTRSNLSVYSKGEIDTQQLLNLKTTNNLADLQDLGVSRNNLLVYSQSEVLDLLPTAGNVGTGNGLYKNKVGTQLNFKSIVAGTGLTINNNTDDITINANAFPSTSVTTDTTNFNNRLTIADNTTQKCFDTLDNYIETDNTVTNSAGRTFGTGTHVKNALDGLDSQLVTTNTNTNTNTTNIANHIGGTYGQHNADKILQPNSTGHIISGTNVSTNLFELDLQSWTNMNNISNLMINKIDTLTTTNDFLTVTNTSGSSKALTVRSNAYITGTTTVIDASGNFIVDGSTKTGHPYYNTGGICIIKDDVIIDANVVINSGSSLIVEGQLIIIGSLTMSSGSSISTRGICHFRGKTNTDTISITSGAINSFDEISFRNYTSTNPANITFSGTSSINGRSVVFDSNSRIVFSNLGTYTITADIVIFSNNTRNINDGNFLIHMYSTTINASIVRFTNNIDLQNYCIVFQDSDVITSNILDFTLNETTITGNAIYVFNSTLSSDKMTFDRNKQNSGNMAVYFTTNSNIIANTLELLNNSATPGNNAVGNDGNVKCEFLQIKTTNAVNAQNIVWTNAPTSQYDNRRTVQMTIYNDTLNPALLSSSIAQSYYGCIAFGQLLFENFSTPASVTLTTAGTYYRVPMTAPTFLYNTNAMKANFINTSTIGEIQYTGVNNDLCEIYYNITASVSSAADRYRIQIWKNGTAITGSSQQRNAQNGTPETINFSLIALLSTNDILYLMVTDLDANNRTYDVSSISFGIKKMIIH